MAASSSRPKLYGVETARGIAAILVVFYHAARHVGANMGGLPFGSISQFGHAGVDFFFVLSGFIILFVHYGDIGRPQRLGHYAERRFTRIYPLYWVALAATLGLIVLSPTKTLPGFLALVRDLFILPIGDTTMGVAWSLQFEIVFYVLFATLILNRTFAILMFAVWGAAFLLALAGKLPLYSNPAAAAYNFQFLMGMAAAVLLLKRTIPAPRAVLIGGAAAFLGFGILENIGLMDGYGIAARFAYGLSAMVTLVGLVEAERSGQLVLPKILVEFGNASYAIYLLHLLVIATLWQVLLRFGLPETLGPETVYLALVAASLAVSVLAARLVEKPLIAGFRRILSRRTPTNLEELASAPRVFS